MVKRLEEVGRVVDRASPVRRRKMRSSGLPRGAPMEPLGINGDACYYLNSRRQIEVIRAKEHNALNLIGLAGEDSEWFYRHWPRYGREGAITGWDARKVAEALIAACARAGLWEPMERERGPGAWRGEDGELILHCGDAVLVVGDREEWKAPGVIGRHVYPAAPALPRPVDVAPEVEAAGERLLDLVRSWNWKRGDVDARLMLGWIGAALIGGALDWRPVAWLTGGRGTGKSTFHALLKHVFDGALIQASDTSAAGIWQRLEKSTLPVACDELEAEESNERQLAVVKLARQAASGGLVLRGGADHRATTFTARSCFLFSSILIPPLLGQDRSRLVILELQDIEPGRCPPRLEPERLRVLGMQLRRRLVQQWSRFASTLARYRDDLAAMGHSARACDQFGTLLAAANLLLEDGMAEDGEVDEVVAALEPVAVTEVGDDEPDEQQCLHHLLTAMIDPWRNGQRNTVGAWLRKAARTDLAGEDFREANRALGVYGIKVLGRPGQIEGLAVANQRRNLTELFGDTRWAGKPGTIGVWVQSLRRLPGAKPSPNAVWIGGATGRATVLPWPLVAERIMADTGDDDL